VILSQFFENINKSQVEERFGGTAKNVEKYFFPHIIPNNDFFVSDISKNPELLIEEKYIEFIKKNDRYVKSPYVNLENCNGNIK